MSVPLTTEQLEAFQRDGFVVVRGFYEAAEIEPIQRGIHAIIGLVMEEQGLTPSLLPENFLNILSHDLQPL